MNLLMSKLDSLNQQNCIQYFEALHVKGMAYRKLTKYDLERDCYMRGSEICQNIYGTENIHYISLVKDLAGACGRLGKVDQQSEYNMMAINIIKDSNILSDSNNIVSMKSLFYLLHYLGDFSEAVEYGERVLSLMHKYGIAGCNQKYINFLNYVALTYKGNLRRQLELHEERLHLLAQMNDTLSDRYLSALNNVAFTYGILGDHENEIHYRIRIVDIVAQVEGISLEKQSSATGLGRAVRLAKSILNKGAELEHYTVFDLCIRFANFAYSIADYGYHEDSIEILELLYLKMKETSGIKNRQSFDILLNLGTLYSKQKQYDQSLKYLEQAKEIASSIFKKNHEKTALIFNELSKTHYLSGDYVKSLEYGKQAVDVYNTTIGNSNTSIMQSLMLVSNSYLGLKDYDSSKVYFGQYLDVLKILINRNFSFMTTKERYYYYENNIKPYLNNLIEYSRYSSNDSISACYSYDFELISTGLLLSSEKEFNNFIRDCNDVDIKSLYSQFVSNRKILIQESDKPTNQRIRNFNELSIKNDDIERELVKRSSSFAGLSRNIMLSWKDVSNSLKPNDVAIEFIHHGYQYSALVLKSGMKHPALHYLCSETDNLLGEWRVYENSDLYEKFWKPLEMYFTPESNIYFAPKGILNQLAIEYAPVSEGRIFMDLYNVHRVSSTRNLVISEKQINIDTVFINGGIRYIDSSAVYLEATQKELEAIKQYTEMSNITTECFSGTNADTRSF